MRLSILSFLSTVLVGLVFATAGLAQGSIPATKASAEVATRIKLAGCVEYSFDEPDCSHNDFDWTPLIDTEINPPGGKDLLITLSMQDGLINADFTSPALILNTSGLRVRICDTVNGATTTTKEDVEPDDVTWDRTLNFMINFVPTLDFNLESGVRSFTFIERNAAVGVHHIVVLGQYQVLAFQESCGGVVGSAAYVGNRTLVAEQVSLAPGTE